MQTLPGAFDSTPARSCAQVPLLRVHADRVAVLAQSGNAWGTLLRDERRIRAARCAHNGPRISHLCNGSLACVALVMA
eukprot:1853483-Prymnesium_polylepis.1